MIFVNSMSDLFHEEVPIDFIRKVFETMQRAHWHTFQILTKRSTRLAELAPHLPWPRNVWQGVTVESRHYTGRIGDLRRVPAALRFLSLEPLLTAIPDLPLKDIRWVIVGGESGRQHRPIRSEWVANIRDQCFRAGVPFFFKQWGGRIPKASGRFFEGREWNGMPRDGQPRAAAVGALT
jgi:protein gp37